MEPLPRQPCHPGSKQAVIWFPKSCLESDLIPAGMRKPPWTRPDKQKASNQTLGNCRELHHRSGRGVRVKAGLCTELSGSQPPAEQGSGKTQALPFRRETFLHFAAVRENVFHFSNMNRNANSNITWILNYNVKVRTCQIKEEHLNFLDALSRRKPE